LLSLPLSPSLFQCCIASFVQAVCPHCGKSLSGEWKTNPFRPFCSERCKALDLGSWASEKFRIEGEKDESGTSSADPSKANGDED